MLQSLPFMKLQGTWLGQSTMTLSDTSPASYTS
jgi:hypothetical protein